MGEESSMDEDVVEQQIDEILEALRGTSGKDVGRDVLEKELRKFLEYGVPFEHAKQTKNSVAVEQQNPLPPLNGP